MAERWCLLKGWLSEAEQVALVDLFGAAIEAPDADATAGRMVHLSVPVGRELPASRYSALTDAARRAFAAAASSLGSAAEGKGSDDGSDGGGGGGDDGGGGGAALEPADERLLERLGSGGATALTAAALAYSGGGSMLPHVDASVARAPKWLAIFSLGLSCDFVLGSDGAPSTRLCSGDALVFDAASVIHGVRRVLPGSAPRCLTGTRAVDTRVSVQLFAALAERAPDEDDSAAGLGALMGGSSSDDDDDGASQ
jgi:hypothetical protein